jgi:hypothetical protein
MAASHQTIVTFVYVQIILCCNFESIRTGPGTVTRVRGGACTLITHGTPEYEELRERWLADPDYAQDVLVAPDRDTLVVS